MILKEFTYKEPFYSINGLQFDNLSLIVGKNAVGKSRSIQMLNQLSQIILQQKDIKEYDSFMYKITFSEGDYELHYNFFCNKGIVIREDLYDNHGQSFINRKEKKTLFYGEEINPPISKLAISTRRDTKLYAEVEEIINWAENAYGLFFNKIHTGDSVSLYEFMSTSEDFISMFEKLDISVQKQIIDKLKDLGYKIEGLEVQDVNSKFKVLHIIETDVKSFLWQGDLSEGLKRTLLLLVYVNYLAIQKKAKTLIIDDFCEGLDYDRSIALGKYLYEFCYKHGIQLITSSNDNFLMDVVNVKYWNILQREGGDVSAINIYNNPKLFEDFEFAGLNNFDLFSSDFIARHKQ